MTPRHRRMMGTSLRRLMIGGILVVMLLAVGVWGAVHVFGPGQTLQKHTPTAPVDVSWFDYVVSVEADRLRVSGTANVPNGVILIGTFDKVGLGPLEVKEALVMHRIFALEFELASAVPSSELGQSGTLAAGTYRLTVIFDPGQQSPFVRESLGRGLVNSASSTTKESVLEVEPALVRVAKTLAIGTHEEQQAAQIREQQYRQMQRQHLDETMRELTTLWQRLWAQYLPHRTEGGFSRADPRALAWEDWRVQWLNELKILGEKSQLGTTSASALPDRFLRDSVTTIFRQLPIVEELYFEVLVQERPPDDQQLQGAEQQLQVALGDARAQLGHPASPLPRAKPDNPRSTVIITSPLVNIRSGPGMGHEVFSQMKKDEVVEFLGEEGEWFQVKLPTGRVGWVHHNVASKAVGANGLTGEAKRSDGRGVTGERRAPLVLQPVVLQATPVDYLPQPTPDEFQIYAEVEQQLRDLAAGGTVERHIGEQRVTQRLAEKYGVSPGLLWNAYLKVQGWQIRQ